MTDDRLSQLLARQSAAHAGQLEAKRKADEADRLKEERATDVRQRWSEERAILADAQSRLNDQMKSNGVTLWNRKVSRPPQGDGLIDVVDLGFTEQARPGDLARVSIAVYPTGRISVEHGTKNQRPAKSQQLDIDNLPVDVWQTVLLDFVDLNTPGEPSAAG